MGWTATKLWGAILARNNEPIRRSLEHCLPDIETILRSASTSPIDFTLHDDQHSFRVAERIFSLADNQIASLSDVELAQLLLSAYLHDIGMSPSRDNVQSHYNYLCTADDTLLNPIERKALQNWLDENWPKLNLPLSGMNTVSGIKLAEEVCAYYCRARHNDWSEDWIQDHLKSVTPGLYPGWVDDLVMLCKSHHEGFNELSESRFDARHVGSPASSVNLRFLAALLRLADVLEFDPERTPQVILQHRNIVPKSRVFWHQDQGIAFKFSDNKTKLIFSARTPDARLHKAVLSIAEFVNAELTCCHNLNQQGAFTRGVISDADRDKYVWSLPAHLTLDVKEKDDSFTYIEGTFRPDVTKLLELLSGTQLYNDPLAAVRELIQNAADAIAEQIGYERLQQDDAHNPDHERTFASLHKVRLTFERESDRLWLRCVDDGVGLNKHQIESRLLRSGANERPEFKALEREARAKGFSVFRTGQFGIGLLSYFMLADRIEFDTKRSEAAGDGAGNAWTFVTEGIASFGELKRSSRDRHGTEVRLRLRDDLIPSDPGDDDKWFSALERYLRATLRHLPCRFELRNNLKSSPIQWSTGPGWTTDAENFASALLTGLRDDGTARSEFVPIDEQEQLDRVESRWSELKSSALERLRWFGPVERIGSYFRARHWVPYFELADGASLGFMDLVGRCINRTPDDRDALKPRPQTHFSWKGFQAHGRVFQPATIGVAEVDILSDAHISINRNTISKLNGEKLTEELKELERIAIGEFLAAHESSAFHILNKRIVGLAPKYATPIKPGTFHWKVDREWKQVSYPFAVIPSASYEHDRPRWTEAKHLDEVLPVLKRVTFRHGIEVDPAAAFGGARLCAVQRGYGVRPAGVWLGQPSDKSLLWTSQFPPEWSKLLFVSTAGVHFWNGAHPIVQKLNKHPTILLTEVALERRFLECLTSEILAARFLFSQMRRGFRVLKALRDTRPAEFSAFVRLLNADAAPIYWQTFESIFSDDTRTFMILRDEIADRRQPFDKKGHLILPDDTVLEKPNSDFQLFPIDAAEEEDIYD